MSQTIEEKNKALVIKVLQTVFVNRDTSVVATHFASNYIQHNPLIPNGARVNSTNGVGTPKGVSATRWEW